MSFICMKMKNHFHIKGLALNSFLYWGPGELAYWLRVSIYSSVLYGISYYRKFKLHEIKVLKINAT